ncbi:MAG: GMC family oxidoreductase, partial [Hyphomicrobiales bacterium]|nr:GMC family oxidoreductase [Hyphomicrobiales bacterium]
TLARELNKHQIKISILESGSFDYDDRTQSLYHGKNIGISSFDIHVNRLRYFGGTTNHWAGHCRPLDDIDFQQRDWVANSGWPIKRRDLNKYYQRAQPIVDLGHYQYEDLSYFTEKLDMPALKLDSNRLKTAVYNQSPPTRLGQKYRSELEKSENITVYLNANLQQLEKSDSNNHIHLAKIACIDGPRFEVQAKIFILATGGMENARLLLLSQAASSTGLGINHELVGKYFMDHILLRPGADISFSQQQLDLRIYHSLHKIAVGQMFGVMAASKAVMQKEKLRNFRIHLVRARPRFERPIARIASTLDDPNNTHHDTEQADFGSIALHLVLEPTPNHSSQLSLDPSSPDLFGQAQLLVDWQIEKDDLRNAHRALQLAALEFGRLGLGRAWGAIFRDSHQWPKNLEAGRHHCGTTRMSELAQAGVVDNQCLCHGLSNLYVAGSSVFPTIG